MAKMLFKQNGQIYNTKRLKRWAQLGWLIAAVLAGIMAKGAF